MKPTSKGQHCLFADRFSIKNLDPTIIYVSLPCFWNKHDPGGKKHQNSYFKFQSIFKTANVHLLMKLKFKMLKLLKDITKQWNPSLYTIYQSTCTQVRRQVYCTVTDWPWMEGPERVSRSLARSFTCSAMPGRREK